MLTYCLHLHFGALPLHVLSAVHVLTLSPSASRCPLVHEYVAEDPKVSEGCDTFPFKGVLRTGQETTEQNGR